MTTSSKITILDYYPRVRERSVVIGFVWYSISFLTVIGALVAISPRIVVGQLTRESDQLRANANSCDVRLTTELLKKDVVKGDDDVSGLSLKLRLIYSTHCDEPRLIYKSSPTVTHYRISKDAESLQARRLIASVSLTTLTENEPSVKDMSLEDFAILSKTSPFETESQVRVFYKKDLVNSGSFLLQIDVDTLRINVSDSPVLTQKFSSFGNILTGVISSEPMKFTVD